MNEALSRDVFEKFFSCFSEHTLTYKRVLYATVEHAYHAQRFDDPERIQEIREAENARKAWEIAQEHKSEQRADWNEKKLEVMEDLLRAKVEQHPSVKEALIASEGLLIVKYEPDDAFWGDGKDGKGRNEMGKLWMKLRKELL